MQEPKPPGIEPFTFVFSWRRFLVHCAIISVCIMLGLMTWYFGKPPSIRFYEATSEEQLATAIAPGIDMALDTRSSIAVKEDQPLQVELFKGNVYFDIKKNATNQLEAKVGNAIIKNFGTRFSIQMQKDGNNHIAVADGYIKIHVASGVYQINASEQADFDDTSVSKHQLITDRNIAPWRSQQ
ncbi:FecR domain-containing protein [Nitrosomonas sp. Nm132]|uniref:FecR domain-containing protein n=1 Tax=Nitrosomonas sp. Nm132 TaxID=1881053 RepID=UPI000887FC21|nr:FecR domain-containing protein [Nitrosomonas sp. Nm132]SDI06734.1 FecR protein [Nitrosomonas sp. Nm132]